MQQRRSMGCAETNLRDNYGKESEIDQKSKSIARELICYRVYVVPRGCALLARHRDDRERHQDREGGREGADCRKHTSTQNAQNVTTATEHDNEAERQIHPPAERSVLVSARSSTRSRKLFRSSSRALSFRRSWFTNSCQRENREGGHLVLLRAPSTEAASTREGGGLRVPSYLIARDGLCAPCASRCWSRVPRPQTIERGWSTIRYGTPPQNNNTGPPPRTRITA